MSVTEARLAILPSENLARFVLSSRWIRNSDQTIKPDAFMPHPEFLDVSVTRHKGLSEQQIWAIGEAIASQQKQNITLYGRADLSAVIVRYQSLELNQDPVPGNPNHATITGWPTDKPAQKSIALQLAAASTYRSYATNTP
jgi:hypothetical protein